MTIIKKKKSVHCSWEYGKISILIHCWWGCKTPIINKLTVPQTAKCRITIWPCHSTPRDLLERNEHICLYMNIHCSITHNNQKVERAQISINWWMDKMWSIYIMEYKSAINRSRELIPAPKWMRFEKHYAKPK